MIETINLKKVERFRDCRNIRVLVGSDELLIIPAARRVILDTVGERVRVVVGNNRSMIEKVKGLWIGSNRILNPENLNLPFYY